MTNNAVKHVALALCNRYDCAEFIVAIDNDVVYIVANGHHFVEEISLLGEAYKPISKEFRTAYNMASANDEPWAAGVKINFLGSMDLVW